MRSKWLKSIITFICFIVSFVTSAATGDACSTAESISPGATCSFSNNKTISGTITPSNTPCNPNNGKFYWLTFNTGGKTSYVVKSQPLSTTSTLDLTMEFYEGACGALNRIDCKNLSGAGALEEYTATGLKKYTDYYILVYHSTATNPTSSIFNICITDPTPVNDECSGALSAVPNVGCNPVNGNLLGATKSTVTGSTSTYSDIWYKFTAVTEIHYITVAGQGDFRPILQLFSSTSPCSGLVSLGTTSTPSTALAKYTFSNLIVGKEYYYRIYHTTSGSIPASTMFTTCVENGILNDNCTGAYNLIPGDPGVLALPTQGVVSGASLSTPPIGATCGTASHANEDVWYSFKATNQKHIFKLTGTDGGFKPCMELLSGTCPTFTSLACKISTTTGGTITFDYSSLNINQTYYLRVYNQGTEITTTPNFEVSVNTPPTNDDCLGAKEVTVGPTCTSEFGDGSFASQSPFKPTCTSTNTNNDDIWYKFKADTTMHFITVNATEGYNPVVEVFKEDCATSILCDDGSFPVSSVGSKIVTGLEKGKYYYYRIFDASSTNPANMAFTTCVVKVVENDRCENAKKVSVGATCSSVGGDGTYATQSLAACTGNANDDVWYKFTATQKTHFISVTPSLKYDPIVQVFKDCTTSLPSPNVFCKDAEYPVGKPGSMKVSGLNAGTTYYYRVYDASASNPSTMGFSTCVTALPENDDCANAKTVYPGANCSEIIGNGSYATESLAGCTGTANDDVWYKFTAQETSQYISVSPDDSKYDPVVQIFSACGTPLNTTSCNDNTYPIGVFGTALITGLTKNSNYYYRVYDKTATNQGAMTFKTCVVTPVVNDDCSGALEVSVGATCNPILGDGTYATQSLVACTGDANDDVWYKFKATKSTQFISVTPDDSQYQPVVQVFSACGSAYSPAVCSLLNTGKFGTTIVSGLQSGVTYYYRVYDENTIPQDTMTFKTCVVEPVKNDECGLNATPVTVGQTCIPIEGDGTYATNSNIAACGSAIKPNDDVWFSFVAGNSKQYINVIAQGTYDPIIQVFSACGTPLAGTLCDDSDYPKGKFGTSSFSVFNLGQTYYYRVYDAGITNNSEMKFTTCVVNPAVNDDCANAKTVTVGSVCSEQTGDGTYATQTLSAFSGAGNANDDVWFKFRPTSSTHVLYVTSSSGYDPVVQLYTGCPAATSNEFKYDGSASNSYNDVRFPLDGTGSITLTGLSTTQDYYYRVYDTKSVFPPTSQLTFTTCVTTIPGPPENDEPCKAKLIYPSVNCAYSSYTNQGATSSPAIQPPGCGDYKGADVWFKVVVPFSGQLTFDTDQEGMSDADMAIYSGKCSDLFLISCDDNSATTGNMSKITASDLIAGDTVWVRIWEKGNDNNGTFGLCVTKPAEATLVNGCSNLDFEGGLSGWFGTTGAIVAGVADASSPNYAPGLFNTLIPQNRFQIETGGIDQYGGFNRVFQGAGSLRLGEGLSGNKGQSIEQYFTVTKENSNFVYNYAVVLQSGGHPSNQQPFFKVDLFDDEGTPINCGEYLVAAPKTGVGDAVGFLKSPAATDVIYKPWTKVSIDLTAYIGKNVHVRFTTGSCAQSAHFGYVYLDCACAPFQIITPEKVCKGDTAHFYAPKGAKSYSWRIESGTVVYTNDTDSLIVKTTAAGKFKVFCDVEMYGTAVCKSTLDTIYEVTNGPTLKITPPDSICSPGVVDLFNPAIIVGSTPNLTYSFLQSDQTTLIPDASKVSKSGTYYIKGEQSATCNAIEPVKVVILPKPEISGLLTVCKGDSTILSSNVAPAIASPWWSKDVSIATISSTAKLKGIESGLDSIRFTDKFGCQRDTIVKIIPLEKPVITCGTSSTNSVEFKWSSVSGALNYDISYVKSGVISSVTNQSTLTFTKSGLTAGDKIQIKVVPKGVGCFQMDTLTCKATNCVPPTISKQPVDTTVCLGNDATFKVSANGTSNGKFQWQKENAGVWTDLSDNATISGAITNTLVIKNTSLSLNSSKYKCIVYEANNACPTNSNSVLLEVKEIPIVFVNDTTICKNDTATIYAKVQPNRLYNYSWSVPSGVINPGNVATFKTTIPGDYTVQVSELNANKLLLCNTDFEDDQITSTGNYSVVNESAISCWETTASDNQIEVWNTNFMGVPSFSGKQFIELNATQVSTIYQEFTPVQNENVTISFAHRGRSGIDEMKVEIGPVGGPYSNLGNFKDGNTSWGYYSVPYTFPSSASGNYVIRFTAVNAAGGISMGNFLDAISIKTKPSCQIQPATGKVIVNVLPTVDLTKDTIICENQSIKLIATGASSYSWSDGSALSYLNIKPATETKYFVTGKDANNCINKDSVLVTVNKLPLVKALKDTAICLGKNTIISASGANTYSWSNGILTASQTVAPIITTRYVVTGVDTYKCVNKDSITVTVNELPNVDVTKDTAICKGSSIDIIASGALSYVWNNGSSNYNQSVSPITTTKYLVTGTDVNKCISKDSLIVTVNNLPNIDITKDTSICKGSDAFLYVKGGVSYVWNDGFTGVSKNVSPIVKTKYLVVGKDANKCENKDSLNVDVFNLPTVDVTKDTFVCKGSSITLKATGASSYKWSNGILIASNTVTPTLLTKYVVTGTDANKCVNKDSVNVDVKLLPVISGGLILCELDSTNLTANVTSKLVGASWSVNDVTKATITNNGKLKAIKAGQTLVNYEDKFGCKSDTLITINPLEKPSLSCGVASGSTVEFTWTPTTLTSSYTATYGILNQIGKTDTLTGLTKYTAKGLSLGDSVWLKVKSNGTGCYLTDSIVCVAKKCPKPEIDVQPISLTVCDKDAAAFEVIKTVDTVVVTYQWQTKNGVNWIPLVDNSINTGSKTSKLQIANSHGLSGNEYRVLLTETSLGVCSLASTAAVLTVNTLPKVSVSNDTSVCLNSPAIPVRFTGANGTAPYTFGYNVDNTGSKSTVSKSGVAYFDTLISTLTARTVTLNITKVSYGLGTATSPVCKLDTSLSVSIKINDLPTIDITKDTSICKGSDAFLYVKGGVSYVWNDGFTGVSKNVSPIVKTKYLVVGKDANKCENKDSLNVDVFSLPIVDVTKDTFVCKGSSITLQATGATSYKWSNGIVTASNTVIPTLLTKYVVTGTDANQCVNKDSVNVDVKLLPVISGKLILCELDSAILTANVASKIVGSSWSVVDVLKASISNNGKLKGIKAGQTLVNYEDKFGCKSDTLITINPLEKPSISCGVASGSTVEFTWTPTSLTTSYTATYGILNQIGKTDTLTGLTKYTAKGLNLGDSVWLKVKSNGTGCYLTDSIVCVAKKCPKPAIDVQPVSLTICDKDVAAFEVIKTVDTVVVTYQWQTKNGINWIPLVDNSTITGSKTSKLQIANSHGLSGNEYRVVLTETSLGVCSLASTVALLTVNTLPKVSVSNDTSVCLNSLAIPVRITGTNGTVPYTFGYTVDNTGSKSTVSKSGVAYFDTLIETLTARTVTMNITKVSYGSGTAASPVCTLDTLIKRLLVIKPYTKAPIRVLSQNLFDVTFEWDSTNVGASDFVVFDSVVSLNGMKSLSFTSVQSNAITKSGNVFRYKKANLSQGDDVYLMVTPIGGSVPRCFESTFSNAKALSCTKPILTTLPRDTAICANQTAIFKVNTQNKALLGSYQWKISTDNGVTFSILNDNSKVSGSKSSDLILNENTPLNPSTKFKVILTDTSGYCKDSSQIVTLIVHQLPTVSFPIDTAVCKGEQVPVKLKFTGVSPWDFTYSDNSSGTINSINGISNSPYILSVQPNSTYTLFANSLKDKFCNANQTILITEDVKITINELPTAVLSGDATICKDDNTNLNISLTGSGPWVVKYTDGLSVITETIANGVSKKLISVNPQIATTYSLISVSDVNCTGTVSGSATINVTTPPSAKIQYDNYYCQNVSTSQQVQLSNGVGNYLGGNFSALVGLKIDAQSGSIIPDLSTPGKYVVSYTFPAYGGCPQKLITSPEFEIRQLPFVEAGQSDTLSCLVNDVQIGTGSTSSANVYEWSGGEIGVVFSTKNEAVTFVNKPGKYTLKITEKNSGCFNTDEVVVAIDTLKPIANAGPDDTLMCNRSQVILDAKLSSAAMSYLWTGGPTGYIIPNATSQKATTNETGIYSLLVTNNVNGCFSRDTVVILENRVKPIVFAADTSVLNLTCKVQKVTLGSERSVKVNGTRYFFSWSGAPLGYIFKNSNQRITEIDTTGEYIIYVRDNYNGCENRDTVLVVEDSKPPIAKVSEDTIVVTCYNPIASLDGSLSSVGSRFIYQWKTNNSTAVITDVTKNKAITSLYGEYVLTVSDTVNGCKAETGVFVSVEKQLPRIQLPTKVYTLTCISPTTALDGSFSSTSPDASYFSYKWSGGPIGVTIQNATTHTAQVDRPGRYYFEVLNTKTGCTNRDSLEVVIAADFPMADAGLNDTLTCATTRVLLGGTSTSKGSDFVYAWGLLPAKVYGGSLPNQSTTEVDQSGSYELKVTNTKTGCVRTDTVVVLLDQQYPRIAVGKDRDTLSCKQQEVALDGRPSLDISLSNVQRSWSGPAGVVIKGAKDEVAFVSKVGTYTLRLSNVKNGCVSEKQVVVEVDTVAPQSVIAKNKVLEISCLTPLATLDGTNSSTSALNLYQYKWSGGPFGATLPTPTQQTTTVDRAGKYYFTVRNARNGCSYVDSVEVKLNSNVPFATAKVDTNLNCTISSVTLSGQGSSSGANYKYEWRGPVGSTLGTADGLTTTTNRAGVYSLTVIDKGSNCSYQAQVRVVIDTLRPKADAGVSAMIPCTSSTVILDGSNSSSGDTKYSYIWSHQLGTATILNKTSLTPSVNKSGKYIVEVSDATNGCKASDTVVVTEQPRPTATMTEPALKSVCLNEASLPELLFKGSNGNAPYAFIYTLNGSTDTLKTQGVSSDAKLQVPTSGAGINTYTLVSVRDAKGCLNLQPATTSIEVKALPTASIAGAATICLNNTTPITFTSTPNARVTYTYTQKVGASQVTSSSITVDLDNTGTKVITTPVLSTTTSFNLEAVETLPTATSPSCKQTLRDTAKVIVLPFPSSISIDRTVACWGEGAEVTITGTPEGTVTYSLNGVDQQVVLSTLGNAKLTTPALSSSNPVYKYELKYVLAKTPACGQSISGTVELRGNEMPTASISANDTICMGTSGRVTITGTKEATVTYLEDGVRKTVNLGASGVAVLTTPTLTVNSVFMLESIKKQQLPGNATSPICSQLLSPRSEVVVLNLPNVSVTSLPELCSGAQGQVLFTGTPNAQITYRRNNGVDESLKLDVNGQYTLSTGTLTSGAAASQQYTYSVQKVLSENIRTCQQTYTAATAPTRTITVYALPTASFAILPTSGPVLQLDTVCPQTTGTIQVTGTPLSTLTYRLDGVPQVDISLPQAGTSTFTTSPLTQRTQYDLFKVVSAQGCVNTVSSQVKFEVLSLPTATIQGNATICWGDSSLVKFRGTPYATLGYRVNRSNALKTATLDALGMFEFWTKPQGNSDLIELEKVSTNAGAVCDNVLSGQRVVISTISLPTATISALESEVCALTSTSVRFTGTPLSVVNYTVDGSALQSIQLDALGNATQLTAVLSAQPTTYQLVSGQVTESGLTCKEDYNQQQTIQVKALPVASMSGSATLCAGQTAQVRFTGTPNATVSYLVDNVATTTVLNGVGESVVTSPVLDTISVYTLVDVTHSTASNPVCGQQQTGQVRLEVRPALKASVVTRDTTVCSTSGYPVVVFKAAQANGYPLNSSKDKYLFTYRIKTDGGVISANYQQSTVLGKDQASVTIPGNYTGSLWVELLSVSYDKLPLCEQSIMNQKVHLNIFESPQIVALTRDTTVCELTEALLTVQTTTSITDKYQWQVKDKITNQWQNILVTDTNFDDETTAKLHIGSVASTMTNTWFRCLLSNDQGGCEVYSNPIKLNVKSIPVKPIVKSNYKLCQNESPVNLNNFVLGSNLIWFTQETGGAAIIGLPTISTNQAGVQQLYVSQKINGCEGPRAVFEVEVKPIPEVLPIGNFEYCANKNTDEIIFTSNPFNQNTQFNWSISDLSVGVSTFNGVGSIPSFITHNNGVNNVNALVKVHPILDGCKGITTEFKISVLPSAQPQVKVVNVDINSVEVEWKLIPNVTDYEVSVSKQYQDGTWGGFIPLETTSNNRSTVSNLNKNEKIEIQVKVLTSTTNACYTEAIVSAITSDCLIPEIIIDPLSQKSCEDSEVTLRTDANFNGATGFFKWQKSENGGLEWKDIQLSGQDAVDFNGSDSKELKITKTSKGLVFRVIALDNATQLCADTSNYAGVEVFEVPSGRFTLLTNKPEVCQGDESIKMMFSANKGLAPYTFEYVINGTVVKKAKSEISDHILIPTDQPIPPTTYKFTKVTDAKGCYMNTGEEIVIAVNSIPQINFNLGNNSGCSPLSISFRDPDMKPGRVVTWDFGNGKPAVLTTNEIVDNTFSSEELKEKTFTVTMKAVEKGCSISKQQKVYLQPNPVANFELDEYTLNQYEPRIISINQSIGATKYRWSFGDGTFPVSTENIEHVYAVKPGDYNVQLIAIANGENCSDTMIRRVRIPDDAIYYVPNTFTPNNDKINNVFTPIFSSGYDPQHYSFQVFDRWGEMIFESRNPSIGWDGTYAGDMVANDVYIWRIEFKEKLTDKKHQKYGNVNLVK